MDSRGEENIALVRKTLAAYNRGDLASIIETMDPAIEIYTAPGLLNAGTYHGVDGFMSWVKHWIDAWESFHNEIRRIEPRGEHHVVAEIYQTARGKGSGAEVQMQVGYLYEIRDGLGTRFHIYPDWDTAAAVADRLRRELEIRK
jgi:ketosteroid isomerase-like protein